MPGGSILRLAMFSNYTITHLWQFKTNIKLSLVETSTSTATTVESLKTSVDTLEDTITTHASSIESHGW